VAPTEATISDLSYPGSRKLYVYVKGEHLAAKPGIRKFLEAYGKAMAKGGMLEQRGLVPFGGADLASATAQTATLTPLDPAGLK